MEKNFKEQRKTSLFQLIVIKGQTKQKRINNINEPLQKPEHRWTITTKWVCLAKELILT